MDINNIYNDTCFMDLCRGSLPEEFPWAHLSRIRAKRILGSPSLHFVHHPHGSVIVDVHHHAVSHVIEGVVLNKDNYRVTTCGPCSLEFVSKGGNHPPAEICLLSLSADCAGCILDP